MLMRLDLLAIALVLVPSASTATDLLQCKTVSECAVEEGVYGCFDDIVGRESYLFVGEGNEDRVLFEDGLVKTFVNLSETSVFMKAKRGDDYDMVELLQLNSKKDSFTIAFLVPDGSFSGISISNCVGVP